MAFSVGDQVFFLAKEHSWILGNVESIDDGGKSITCSASDALRKQNGDLYDKLKPEKEVAQVMGSTVDEDVDDLLNLTILHESSLLRTLCIRYMRDIIYTNIGAIVVALNPFTFNIPWYKDDCMVKYLDEGHRIEKNVPHTWAVSHNTYWELFDDLDPQFILVSGESGAGKTEASKIVVKYFAALSDRALKRKEGGKGGESAVVAAKNNNNNDDDNGAGQVDAAEVGRRLQRCSPILESFGNAKTVRNDNSSRFGKFMKIQFSPDGVLLGAKITRYLLEKSRILMGAKGERVYHAFYLVCRGEFAKEFSLLQDKEYKSLSSGQTLNNPDFDTEADFNEVAASMRDVGLDDLALRSVWAVVAAVITLINIDFVSDGGEGSNIKPAHTQFAAQAAKLLKIDGEKLAFQLVKSEVSMRGELTTKLHTPIAAQDVRDALCKATYDGLFGDLCTRCNKICDAKTDDNFWVGLLDIFGFEDFEKNSFEQLCINLANETLQGHYNTYVFNKDLEECALEGIDTVDIICPDNTPCLRMVSDPKTGLFALLDDECSLGKGTDKSFLDASVAKFKDHPDFVAFKISKVPSFGVKHYAGMVTYDVSNFLDKNRDTLKDSLKLLIRESENLIVSELIAPPAPKTGRGITVSGFFRTQLGELMDIINSSHPHWIRCIKPHPAKKPKMFHGRNTMLQLESSGVLGTVKIRKAGYPVRILFKMFLDRFMIFLPQKDAAELAKAAAAGLSVKELRLRTVSVLKRADIAEIVPQPKLCQIGKTKVFLKSEGLTPLEKARRDEFVKRVVIIQKAGRAYRGRKPIMHIAYRKAIEHIVAEYRSYLDRTKVERERRAAAEKIFRAAMAEGTEELTAGFTEAGELAVTQCCDSLVDVYIEALLDREPLLRTQILKEECDVWVNILVTMGEELISKAEQDLRYNRIERAWGAVYNMILSEFIEHQIFSGVLIEEKRVRATMQTEMLEELRVAAGDPEVRMTLLLGSEEYRRELLVREALSVYPGWARQRMLASFGDFFEDETERRARIAEDEVFERSARKKFERKRVWVALTMSLFADEEYDRAFLVKSEGLYREDIQRGRQHASTGTKVDEGYRILAEREKHERRGIFKNYEVLMDQMAQVFREHRFVLLFDEVEYDEEKFRRIVQEAFFATLAVQSPSHEVYLHYLQHC